MAFLCPQKTPSPSSSSSTPAVRRPLPPLPTTSSSPPLQLYHDVPGPAQQVKARLAIICRICATLHRPDITCPSKPPEHPNQLFPACDICEGYHPAGYCYFDFLRASLYTYAPCARCNGLAHTGFCQGSLLCRKCGKRHNGTNTCPKRELQDISNNICPQCKAIHIFHCTSDLQRIDISLTLWCNRCKLCHQFMKCTPFCSKCLRHHLESTTCPEPSDFCTTCMVCHSGQPCPRLPIPTPPVFQPASSSPLAPLPPPRNNNLASAEASTQSLFKVLSVSPITDQARTPFPRKTAKRRSETSKVAPTPRPPPQPPQTPASPQIDVEHLDEGAYFCPEDCANACCKPVRFFNSPSSLTPLPTFTEALP